MSTSEDAKSALGDEGNAGEACKRPLASQTLEA